METEGNKKEENGAKKIVLVNVETGEEIDAEYLFPWLNDSYAVTKNG